ncbi:hypothetical protein CMALT394_130056 [Carnobacterium maltaromaticum]|nr:hypothetical protein CMALT394_130056 [Carnobacterium maltaromaticum]
MSHDVNEQLKMATQTTRTNNGLFANLRQFKSPLGEYARDRESQKTNMVGGKQKWSLTNLYSYVW